jgi:5-methylcytosine-specific restriction endonuclease McrA
MTNKEKALDKKSSEKCREKGICENCGQILTKEEAHPHHFIRRRHKSVRWDQENLVCLCWKCHDYAHRESESFKNRMIKIKGEDWHNNLIKKSNQIFKKNY